MLLEELSKNEIEFVNHYIKRLKEHLDDQYGKFIIYEAREIVLNETIKNLEKINEELKSRLQEFSDAYSVLEQDKNKIVDVNVQIDTDLKNSQDKINVLVTQLTGLRSELDGLKSEKSNLQHILNQKNVEIDLLEKKISGKEFGEFKKDDEKSIKPSRKTATIKK